MTGYSLLTNLKLELWIHCVYQVPEGSRVKLQRTRQIVYQIVSAVMLLWSIYFRTGLSWCVKCRICVRGVGAAYQAVLDSYREPGAGSGQAVC